METEKSQSKKMAQLGWFLLLWSAGVLTLGVTAFGIRLLMNSAGLSS